MNGSALLHAINNINDEYLTEADEPVIRRSYKKQIFGISTAAALVLALVGGSLALHSQRQPLTIGESHSGTDTSSKHIYTDIDPNESSSEIAILTPWEELSIAEQYSELDFDNYKYSGRNTVVPNDSVGQSLGASHTLSGYDEINEEAHQTYGEVSEIKGISSQCAVAVKHKDSEQYYVYVNAYYRPETLGQFMDDLSLEDNLIFNSVWYEYTDENGNSISTQYSEPPQNAIWDILLSDRNAVAVDLSDQPTWGIVTVMDMSIDIPILGYENISISITEDGYLRTNILDTEKVFNIGVDRANELVSYVKENWDDIKEAQTSPVFLDD
ncbi:MAG: hypothetical protein ACI4RP_00680 [Acutalibacteraceae bacterium]